jgi:hypothetical protein
MTLLGRNCMNRLREPNMSEEPKPALRRPQDETFDWSPNDALAYLRIIDKRGDVELLDRLYGDLALDRLQALCRRTYTDKTGAVCVTEGIVPWNFWRDVLALNLADGKATVVPKPVPCALEGTLDEYTWRLRSSGCKEVWGKPSASEASDTPQLPDHRPEGVSRLQWRVAKVMVELHNNGFEPLNEIERLNKINKRLLDDGAGKTSVSPRLIIDVKALVKKYGIEVQ